MSEKKTFCQLLDEAIKDEEKAKDFYAALIEAADREYPAEAGKGVISEKSRVLWAVISNVESVEGTHKELFERLKFALCEP